MYMLAYWCVSSRCAILASTTMPTASIGDISAPIIYSYVLLLRSHWGIDKACLYPRMYFARKTLIDTRLSASVARAPKGGVPCALVVLGINEKDCCLPLQRSLVATNPGPESRFNQCDPRNSDKIDEGFGVR